MKTRSQTLSKAIIVTLSLVASSAALANPPQWAKAQGHRDQGNSRHQYRDADFARVIDVDPIIRRVRVRSPQQECWNDERPVSSRPSRTEIRSTIVGGLIGAAVGHHISAAHRLHDPAAVVGGSMIGAAIGNSIGAHKAERRGEYREVGYESVQRCEVSYREAWAEEIDGYRVTYVYNGRHYTTRMPYDPGRRVQVGVDVRPDYGRRY